MTSGNDTQEGSKRSKTALMIREGANLAEDAWRDARVAAVLGQLPREIRELPKDQFFASAIQFFGTAQRYDLDPMQGEIFGWWDRNKGQMVCMVGRDGLLKISTRDKDILGVQSDIVREGDQFRKVQKGDKIDIEHVSEPFADDTAETIGAYCLIKKREGPDVFVARRKDQFKNLFGKRNWQTNPDEMLETRVISFALRKSTALLAGVYTEGDYAFVASAPPDGAPPVDRRKELPATSRSEALADELEGVSGEPVEIEAEVVEEDEEAVDIKEQGPAEPYVPMLETDGSMAPGYFVENLSRGWCQLWRVADQDEEEAGQSIYAPTAGCHVILVTDKKMRLPDLVNYAKEDFQRYEQEAQATLV